MRYNYLHKTIIKQILIFVNSISEIKGGKMCRICGKYICPPACPSYEGESAERGRRTGWCRGCGEALFEYDEVRYSGGKPYCFACYIEVERYERGDYDREDEGNG